MIEAPQSNLSGIQLERNAHGRLVLTLGNGLVYEAVVPVRAFPIAAPAEGSDRRHPRQRHPPAARAGRSTRANAAAASAALTNVIQAKAPAGDSGSAPTRPVPIAAQPICRNPSSAEAMPARSP